MTKIKIGIIGSGGMARHHLARFTSIEDTEVVAIASRNEQTGTQLAKEHTAVFMPEWDRLVATRRHRWHRYLHPQRQSRRDDARGVASG